jgi:hypothetical protein
MFSSKQNASFNTPGNQLLIRAKVSFTASCVSRQGRKAFKKELASPIVLFHIKHTLFLVAQAMQCMEAT